MPEKVSAFREENVNVMNLILPVQESFDILQRDLYIGERAATLYFVNGFIKDDAVLKIMESVLHVKKADMPADVQEFSRKYVPYASVEISDDYDKIIKVILSGLTCLFIDGYDEAIVIDCREYPARGVEEPDKDKSLRGSRD